MPSDTSTLHHGGGIDAAAERYGVPVANWLDLSTGINPVAYPIPEIADEAWAKLPDRAAERRLIEAAARYYGVPDADQIVAVPGTQSAIQWLPRMMPKSRVAVVTPTYTEHAHAWAAIGHEVTEIPSPAEASDAFNILVAVNPNNPDGTRHEPGALLSAADQLDANARLMLVDEAFADVCPEVSLASQAATPGLMILRSFGKFFGLAGLRLGFILTSASTAAHLRRAFGPWAVPGPSAAIAIQAFDDADWIAATRTRLAADSARLERMLVEFGMEIIGGTSLYSLAHFADAGGLFDHLASAGILTRRFADAPQWLRFGLPADDAGFVRLNAALTAWGKTDAVSA